MGLGPGPHLEIPADVLRRSKNAPVGVDRPKYGLAPNFEAHNTVLDLFMQGGLLVLLVCGWLTGTALLGTYSAKLDALTALLCGFAIFGAFHFIFRHPIVWVAFVFCLIIPIEIRRVAESRVGGDVMFRSSGIVRQSSTIRNRG